jgi:hypothetical protein
MWIELSREVRTFPGLFKTAGPFFHPDPEEDAADLTDPGGIERPFRIDPHFLRDGYWEVSCIEYLQGVEPLRISVEFFHFSHADHALPVRQVGGLVTYIIHLETYLRIGPHH